MIKLQLTVSVMSRAAASLISWSRKTHSASFLEISAKVSSSLIVGTSGVLTGPKVAISEAIFDAKGSCRLLKSSSCSWTTYLPLDAPRCSSQRNFTRAVLSPLEIHTLDVLANRVSTDQVDQSQ